MPRVAPTLYDFVELENGDYLKVSEAVFRIFDRQDWLRVNRARARIKVLIDKIGIDEFRDAGRGGAQGRLGRRARLRPHRPAADPRRGGQRARGRRPDYASARTATSREFDRFRASNVKPQRQEGFSTVQVRVYRGDLTPEQFRGLAQIMRDYSGGYARTTVEQNFVLRWVRDESVYEVWQALSELGLGEARRRRDHRHRLLPGHRLAASSASPARWASTRAIKKRLEEMDIEDPLTKQIHIKIPAARTAAASTTSRTSGSTARRSRSATRRSRPTSRTSAARYEGGEVVYGTRLKSRLPAKRVPDAVERWLRYYEAEREDGEEFNAFAERVGPDELHRAGQGPVHARGVQPREHGLLHRLEARRALPGHPGRGRVRGRSRRPRRRGRSLERAARGAPSAPRARLLLPEGGVGAAAHAARSIVPDARVFTIDTGVLFPETYATWRELEQRYGVKVEVFDAASPTARRGRPSTAAARAKVAALEEALDGLDAWITGLRREQAPTRAAAPRAQLGRARAASGRSTRWPTGPRRTCGATSPSTTCPTTRCTTRATPRSAARPAPSPAPAARAAGPAQDKTECGLHVIDERRRPSTPHAPTSSPTCARWSPRPSTSSARSRPSCERPVLLF